MAPARRSPRPRAAHLTHLTHLARRPAAVALVAAAVSLGAAQPAARPAGTPAPAALLGEWRVDLRPDPAAAPYAQPFVVTGVQGDSVVGTFYGSPVQAGRFNRAWGRLHVAFTTADRSGVYHHTAVLVAPDSLEGTTHSLGRGFLMVWRAARVRPGSGAGGADR